MSTENAVYKLKRELAFWQKFHEHEPMSEIEFKLERQIRQLENRDEFGEPRYNGHLEDNDEDDDANECGYVPQLKTCRYCGKTGLHWRRAGGKWRLAQAGVLHVCDAHKNRLK